MSRVVLRVEGLDESFGWRVAVRLQYKGPELLAGSRVLPANSRVTDGDRTRDLL